MPQESKIIFKKRGTVFKQDGRQPMDEKYTWDEMYQYVVELIPKLSSTHFRKWFREREHIGKLFDPVMIARCYSIYKEIHRKDRDHFWFICGKEGSGKSTLASQIAAWIDPNFKVDNFCFDVRDYVEKVKTLPKGSSIVLDEGGVALFSRSAMGIDNKKIVRLFMLQRQKNFNVIVVCPSFYDIDTYVRKHRVNTLIRVINQGDYMGYLPKAISIINEVGYRKKPLSAIKIPNGQFWYGTFTKPFPKYLKRDDYVLKKGNHLEDFLKNIDKTNKKGELAKEIGEKLSESGKNILKID